MTPVESTPAPKKRGPKASKLAAAARRYENAMRALERLEKAAAKAQNVMDALEAAREEVHVAEVEMNRELDRVANGEEAAA